MKRDFRRIVAILVVGWAVACGGSGELESIRELLGNDPAAAEVQARALLEATEIKSGNDALEVAEVLDVLVEAMRREGNTGGETLLLARRALSIKTAHLDEDHPHLGPSLRNLGEVLRLSGEYEGAGRHFRHALRIAESGGVDHSRHSLHLRDMGNLQLTLGLYVEALEYYERALAMAEREFSADDKDLVPYLYNVSITLRRLGRFADARPYLERTLALMLAQADPDPGTVAAIRNGLGVLLWETGDYAGARSEFERVLEIRVQKYGEGHLQVTSSLNNLGRLFLDTGDYENARSRYERSLAIRREQLDPGDIRIATSLQNLGTLLIKMGQLERAEALLNEALEIRIQHYGELDTRVANTLTRLAELSSDRGDFATAEALHHRAIAILGETLGTTHPEYGWHLQGLARIREERGDRKEALETYLEVLEIRQATLGTQHPLIAETASHLARTQARSGNVTEAFAQALRAERLSRDHLMLTARTLPEREALRYADVRSSGLDIALTLLSVDPAPVHIEKAWDAMIRSRALVLDEMAARHRATVRPADPEVGVLYEEFEQATRELAKLTVRGVGENPEGYRESWDQARERRERAERILAERSRPFREELNDRRIGLSAVAERLPPRAALVGFVLYGHFDLSADRGDPTPSYLAFVLRPGKQRFAAVPLGPAERIDQAIMRWKSEAAEGSLRADRSLVRAETAYMDAAGALHGLIWEPLRSHLDEADRAFIVPDSALNLVGFYALADRDGRYLIEGDLLVHYLAAERDLAHSAPARDAGHGLLAVGGPDFDSTRSFTSLSGGSAKPRQVAASSAAVRSAAPACAGFSSMRFERLPEAEREADEIVRLWTTDSKREALRLSGEDATEAAFKLRAPGRRIVHLATHGFFLGSGCDVAGVGARGIGGLSSGPGSSADDGPRENPLLLSGLVLAGANHRGSVAADEEDGILTSNEIAAMDLSSVEWAVLSACDTGVGEIQAGEGVFGLRRAFQVAGAATTIMSLWSVEDASTRAWMRALYEARLNGQLDTSRAVREASLELLRESRRRGTGSHPFSWGGWVAAGDYR